MATTPSLMYALFRSLSFPIHLRLAPLTSPIIPQIPRVTGLDAYIQKFPGRVVHSKYYRSPLPHTSQHVLVIGNSASGRDITTDLLSCASLPVYQSRRSRSRWDGDAPPSPGIQWKPVITEYDADAGTIVFADGTTLGPGEVDTVIYCTGYKPSFPFWNTCSNGQPLWDYTADRLVGSYWHTFFRSLPTLGIVGLPRVLTFRSFEYQAIALARIFSNRNARPLPPLAEQEEWERERAEKTKQRGTRFHDIRWEENGRDTIKFLDGLFRIAGLGTLKGEGRIPPPLTKEMIWAIENIKKYPEPGKDKDKNREEAEHIDEKERDAILSGDDKPTGGLDNGWVYVDRKYANLLGFI